MKLPFFWGNNVILDMFIIYIYISLSLSLWSGSHGSGLLTQRNGYMDQYYGGLVVLGL